MHAPLAPATPRDIAPPPLVRVDRLTRAYGRRRALDGVSFELGAGECLALFGPNGAGKTTLLRVLAGLLRPTSGRASIGGVPLPGEASARGAVGLISHQSMLYPALTARENVAFAARLQGVVDPDAAALAALDRLGLRERAETLVRALSRGMQQRVSIARAIVHDPSVLLLDEPYTGLDELGARALTDQLRAQRDRGAALVLVTHNLNEGLALATHAAILRAGRLVRHDPRAAIDPAAYADDYRALVGVAG